MNNREMKLKWFKIKYFFDGLGEAEVCATSKEQAAILFADGNYKINKEFTDGVYMDTISELRDKNCDECNGDGKFLKENAEIYYEPFEYCEKCNGTGKLKLKNYGKRNK